MHSFDAGLNEMIASRRRFSGPNVLELCEAADVVFLALHGANGEDGKVQATFDLLGIPYTGTGYLSAPSQWTNPSQNSSSVQHRMCRPRTA